MVKIGCDLPRIEENGGEWRTPTRSQTKASHVFKFSKV